ncbi:MAG: class III poly(R)-hydroxyalkanoic acid synthase subunit PhaE [Anaerolineales bacterium]|jgi:class III poly(R)-hydroxyalkanoic acid synthase PhaE subunit
MSDKSWGELNAEMLRSWSEAQRTLWEAWMDTARNANQPGQSFADIADEWQKLVSQSLQAWSDATDPIARSTAEQFIASQGVMLRFIDFAARAWETAAPQINAGADWQQALSESMEQLRAGWVGLPAQAAALNQDVANLWQLYLDQWRTFGQPWENIWNRAPALWGRAVSGDSAAVFELTDAYQQAYQQTIGRLASSPNLGLARESSARMQAGFDAFVTWNLASLEYQAVMAEIWDAAFKRFGEDLAVLAEKGEKIETVRELVTLWTRGAEQVFLEAFKTERYTLAQGKLLNATMLYRIQQRRILEDYLEAFDLPTRSEIDEAHRRIYLLNKEVKALKKQVAGLTEAQNSSKPASSSKRRSAKSS